jgi:Fe(3+) dicitrate transport protein
MLALPWGFDVTTTAYRNHFKRNWYKLQSVNGTSIGGVLSAPGAHPEAMAILQGTDSEADALYLRANNRAYESMGLETLVGWRGDGLGMAHSLEAGLRLHRDDEDRLQWEDGFRMRGGRMERTSQGAPGSQANRLAAARATSLFMQDQISVGRLTVSPGIRFESVDFTRTDWSGDDPSRGMPTRVRENSVSAWIPGVGAALQVNAATHLFGGVHRGFAPPGAGVDPATRPERSVNYEAGVRYRERGMALTTTAFYSDYDNILGQGTLAVGEEGIGEQFNGGRVDISGIELEIDVDPLWGRATAARLPLRVSYTFTQAEFASSFDSEFEPWGSVQAGDRLPYLPSHQFAASAGLERGAWSFDANVFGNSAMRTVAGQGAGTVDERTDAFAIVNLSADYELAQGGSVYVGLQNVLDQRYITARRPAGTRPGLPRTLMVGYRIGG